MKQITANVLVWLFKRTSNLRIRRYLDRKLKKIIGTTEITVKTIWGAKMIVRPEDFISRRIAEFGSWEPQITWLVKKALKKGDVAIDIGANIGYYSCLFSELVGPNGKVFSIEALPPIYNYLNNNIEINALENIETYNLAVSDKHELVQTFLAHSSNIGMSTIMSDVAKRTNAAPQSEIEARPLLEIISRDEATNTKLIKIDTEGAELKILRSLTPLLIDEFRNTTWLIEFSVNEKQRNELLETLKAFTAAGYRLLRIETFHSIKDYQAFSNCMPTLTPLTAASAAAANSQLDILITKLNDEQLELC